MEVGTRLVGPLREGPGSMVSGSVPRRHSAEDPTSTAREKPGLLSVTQRANLPNSGSDRDDGGMRAPCNEGGRFQVKGTPARPSTEVPGALRTARDGFRRASVVGTSTSSQACG